MGSAAPEGLQGYSRFQLRRTIERLREGLYDPLAVRLLTADREELEARLRQDLLDVAAGAGAHLCVCGAYGQGKSHTLAFLQEAALQQGYAVSAINLDPREAPLHQFRQVYRALLQTLTFPAGSEGSAAHLSLIDAWNVWVRAQPLGSEDRASALAALLPVDMPHVFKAILVALVQLTLEIPLWQQQRATDRDFRLADIPWTLQHALQGEFIPAVRLRTALKCRQVSFYRDASLALHGDEPFLRMVLALPQLFRRMGYPGWVLLFDEGEAVAQVRRSMRARSYRILHRLLCPDSPHPGLYPVFAFTPDFFHRLQEEDYHLPDLTVITPRPGASSPSTSCAAYRGRPGKTSATLSSPCTQRPMAGMPTASASCRCSPHASPRCPCRTPARRLKPWSTSSIRSTSRNGLCGDERA